jgi:calcineurin-like phosphoesterase family protein
MRSNVALTAAGCALLLVVCGGVAECAPVSGGWNPNPAIVQLDTSEEIFAIGDPHGDPYRLATVLAAAGLIERIALVKCPQQLKDPPTVNWTGGRKVLVITGDFIDKGCDSIGVILLVRALQSDAAAKGGRVVVTLGNHEAEFLDNWGGSKTAEFSTELTARKLKPEEVAKCKDSLGLGEFLCGLPIAARVNDWFFSHAGNTGGKTIEDIGKLGIHRLANDGNSIVEARLNKKGPSGLPWFYAGNCDTDPKTLLGDYAARLKTTEPKVKHLVQGHQYGNVNFYAKKTACSKKHRKKDVKRDDGQFFQRYGLLFLIDTGMSIGIKDSSQSGGGALRITGSGSDKKASVICPNGDQTPLWPQQHPDYKETFCAR